MNQLRYLLTRFVREEAGQDLIEYTLLLAFVALAAAALFPQIGASISTVWSVISSLLAEAASSAV